MNSFPTHHMLIDKIYNLIEEYKEHGYQDYMFLHILSMVTAQLATKEYPSVSEAKERLDHLTNSYLLFYSSFNEE